MIRISPAKAVLLTAVLLTIAVPAVTQAATRPASSHSTSQVALTPRATALSQNLLQNPGFESADTDGTVPSWTSVGVHLEKFGTRTWPSPAYSKKYHGGDQYLACGSSPSSGAIRQSVDFSGWTTRDFTLKARLAVNFGGLTGEQVRAAIRITDDAKDDSHREQTRVLNVTDSYKRIVVTLLVPTWAQHIEATIELMPKDGAPRCHMVADSASLSVLKP